MSIVAPIVATCAIVPVLAGVHRRRAAGRAAVDRRRSRALAGVALASREPGGAGRRTPSKALQLALIAALAIGLSPRLPRQGRRARRAHRRLRRPRRRGSRPRASSSAAGAARRGAALPQLGGIGLLDTGANTAFAIATTGGLLSLVAVLGGLFPVVTVALAYLLLHERLQPTQRAGVILALAGIPLIST